jgi:hypothetical protein
MICRQTILLRENAVIIQLVPKREPPASGAQHPATMEELLAQITDQSVTDKIRKVWGSACGDAYLNSLLLDDREGHCDRFPPEASHAIFMLITLNEIARRRAGAKPALDAVSGLDWANETGQWKIVKSRELKVNAEPVTPTGAALHRAGNS